MFVSVIVPIYNVEKYLIRCLDSLMMQSYKQYEVLMIDDGSTDGSGLIAKEYDLKYQNFKYFYKENGGLSDARNFGMKFAKGDAISFLDSDDWYSTDFLLKMVNKMNETNSDVVCCDIEYIDDFGNTKFSSGGDFDCVDIANNPSLITINNSSCNKLIKKTCIANLIFPVGKWYEDLGTIPIILSNAKTVSKVHETLYFYYQRSGSISHTENEKVFDIYFALDAVKQYLEKNNKPNAMIEAWEGMYILHGADLTTLRISHYRKNVRIDYMRKNVELLNQCYPEWIKDSYCSKVSAKKKVLFLLLYFKQFKLIDILLHRK